MDPGRPVLPDALTRLSRLEFLEPAERGLMSRVQGRTHANVAAFLEEVAGARRVALAASCSAREANRFERLVRLLDEVARREARFRRIELRLAAGMPPGYAFAANPTRGVQAFLACSTPAVLALAWHARACRHSNAARVAPGEALDPGFREVFEQDRRDAPRQEAEELAHWREAGDAPGASSCEAAADEFVGLLRLLDGLLYRQARADATYFSGQLGRLLAASDDGRLMRETLAAYRAQFIGQGASEAGVRALLGDRGSPEMAARIESGIASLIGEAVASP